MFMNLLKAFDTINHELPLERQKAYDFSKSALDLICSFLKKKQLEKQKKAGAPQEFINGLLF